MNTVYYEEITTKLDAFQIYQLFFTQPYSFFLDSGMDRQKLGRYSFIGCDPFLRLEAKGAAIVLRDSEKTVEINGDPFRELQTLLHTYQIQNTTEFPFVGGAVGYLAYDLCHHLESLPQRAVADIELPAMAMAFYDGIILVDHLLNKTYAVSAGFPKLTAQETMAKVRRLKRIVEEAPVPDYEYLNARYAGNPVHLESNLTQADYCRAVEAIQERIRCGDIYQMNMTQRFTTLINRHPLHIYQTLRTINPAPFAAFLDLGDCQVVSSSPERFLQIRQGQVETRPIKGTMPRGKTEQADEENSRILQASTKDRAEHFMIVDVARNDLGRVCKIGTVKTPELFRIEKYSTVFQMVSTITGELRDECDAVDCLTAAFPGGSITGAPKIRAMELIDALEPTCRHIYTGSLGYIGFDGDMDMSIVIRTILITGDRAYYQVGGGIVWDSSPADEYQESLDKGLALQQALLADRIIGS